MSKPKVKVNKIDKFMNRAAWAARSIKEPVEAMNMVYEIRGFIVSNFTTLDVVKMQALYEHGNTLFNIANKKKKKP